jgi:hypothetical protein
MRPQTDIRTIFVLVFVKNPPLTLPHQNQANLLSPYFVPKDHPLAGFLAFSDPSDIPSLDDLLKRYASKRQNPKMESEVLQQRIYLYVAFQVGVFRFFPAVIQ